MTKGVKKFDKKHRVAVAKAIKQYLKDNPDKQYADVAKQLNDSGIPHPNADSWSVMRVGNFIQNHLGPLKRPRRSRRARTASIATPKLTGHGDSLVLAELILGANIADTQKQRLLAGLFTK